MVIMESASHAINPAQFAPDRQLINVPSAQRTSLLTTILPASATAEVESTPPMAPATPATRLARNARVQPNACLAVDCLPYKELPAKNLATTATSITAACALNAHLVAANAVLKRIVQPALTLIFLRTAYALQDAWTENIYRIRNA